MHELTEDDHCGTPIVSGVIRGEIDFLSALKLTTDLLDAGIADPDRHVLVDFAGVTGLSIGLSELRVIATHIAAHDRRRGRSAYVTGNGLRKVIMANVFAGLMNAIRPNRAKAFRHTGEALAWLRGTNAR